MDIRIHRWGENLDIDAQIILDGDAYVRKDSVRFDEVIFIVRRPENGDFIQTLNHEVLHVVLARLGLRRESNLLDRVSNYEDSVRHGGRVGGL